MPGPLAIITSAGIMFTFIWAVCKVFNLNPSVKGNYQNGLIRGFVSGFIVGADDSATK
jgi:hypothetical protein